MVETVPQGGKPQKFSHGFFDKEVAPLRAVYFKIVGMMTIVTIIVMCKFFLSSLSRSLRPLLINVFFLFQGPA